MLPTVQLSVAALGEVLATGAGHVSDSDAGVSAAFTVRLTLFDVPLPAPGVALNVPA